jgi:hypothetical protein
MVPLKHGGLTRHAGVGPLERGVIRRIVAFTDNGWNYALRCARRRRIHSPARLGRKRLQATGPLKQRSLKGDGDHVDRRGGVRGDVRERQWNEADFQRRITFELSWHQRWDARARLARMYKVPPTWPAWPAVGAQLERGVRPHWVHLTPMTLLYSSGPQNAARQR